jgi:hypothetical protein
MQLRVIAAFVLRQGIVPADYSLPAIILYSIE